MITRTGTDSPIKENIKHRDNRILHLYVGRPFQMQWSNERKCEFIAKLFFFTGYQCLKTSNKYLKQNIKRK